MLSGEVAKRGSIRGWVLGSLDLQAELGVGDVIMGQQYMAELLAYQAEVWPNRVPASYPAVLHDGVFSSYTAVWYLDARGAWHRGAANRMLLLYSLIMTVDDCCLGVVGNGSPEHLQELQRCSLSERQGSSSHAAQKCYSLARGEYFWIFKPFSTSPPPEKIRCST